MALSLSLSQHPSFSDLQAFFDPTPAQQQEFLTKFDLTSNFEELSQMEYTNQHQPQQHYQQQQQQQQQQQNNNNNNIVCFSQNNNNNNNSNSNNSNTHPSIIGNINQTLIPSNRSYMSGYHYQHTGVDYEQVINFVDSPPNSEESWTDENSKPSPGPQIIDVQTIYSNSGSRKRRMDWDSLEIGQTDNSTSTPNGEIPNKITITNDKEKQKREKLSGRGSWTDEIGFDLNTEFNSNSYLNNESFLSFSPALTVLKQEPQTEHLKGNKSPLNSHTETQQQQQQSTQANIVGTLAVTKFDKSSSPTRGGNNTDQQRQQLQDEQKNDLNINVCRCGSPQSSQQGFEQNKQHGGNNGNGSNVNAVTGNGSAFNAADKCNLRRTAVTQQLNIVDVSNKLENNNSNHGIIGGASSATSQPLDDNKFQYILAAATSIATKNNEETLTYLNQGQSYEIKLKKIGDLTFYRDKILKSVIKICFHERRLQFMEREQMQQWQQSRPGERIIEVDVPLSYGLCHVSQPLNPNSLNTVEVFWDPFKEVGVYIKVNCISTEFTPKKHGGEKGVPFKLQIETYIETTTNTGLSTSSSLTTSSTSSLTGIGGAGVATASAAAAGAIVAVAAQPTLRTTQSPLTLVNVPSPGSTPGNLTPTASNALIGSSSSGNNSGNANNNGNNNNNNKLPVHAAACQIKVFKLKGADRKHKQDREKIQKRPQSEQEKFQPSYECTIMNDIPLDQITPAGCFSPEYMKIWPNSPVHIPKYDGILPYASSSPANNSSPIAINSVTSTNSPTLKLMDTNMVSPQQATTADLLDDLLVTIVPDSTPAQVTQWLTQHRLNAYLTTFTHFSGSDILRMSKEDLIQICGLADGIRMFNILRAKAISPRLTIYVSLDGSSFNAIYLVANTSKELMQKIFKLPGFYDAMANSVNNGTMDGNSGNNTSGGPFGGNWNLHSKYSGSGSNIFNDVSKSFIYLSGPGGAHINITDEVLNNEIKDGSLYGLEVQNGKVVMKLINKSDN